MSIAIFLRGRVTYTADDVIDYLLGIDRPAYDAVEIA